MINVFFPYYQCGDKDRQKEIDLCLRKNAENELIDKLFVVIDDGCECPVKNSNIQIINIDRRLTYKYWVDLTHRFCSSGISLLCNSDIHFDESLSKVKQVLTSNKQFLALSRWELLDGTLSKHPNPHWSQDCWGFRVGEEFSPSFMHQLDFPMGVPRCDNKIAYLFATQGWQIFNPVDELKSIHVHETQMRTYHKKLDDRILGGVAYVYPGMNLTDEASLDVDVWTKRTGKINKVAINKAMEKWIREAEEAEGFDNSNESCGTSVALIESSARELVNAINLKNVRYSSSINFEVLESGDFVFFKNSYEFNKRYKIEASRYKKNESFCNVAGLIPPVINTYSQQVGIKASSPEDLNFWQYPCATEKQAFENHLKIKSGEHVDVNSKIVNVYLPIPWATYVDKKDFPDDYLTRIKTLVEMYQTIASDNGFTFKVHSVCQHIHWVRMLEKAQWLGVTDFHLSHKDSKSDEKQAEHGTNLTLHGWPLIAVNYETPDRSEGMERKPISERKLLASFIGAHMPHYRDDSRIKLFEAAKACGRDDVFVDLGNEWHFNKVVYEEQVLNKEVEAHHIDEHHKKTFRYNSILSDSKFSLCPEGAGPNTLRFWESIAVGSIPVIFSDDLAAFLELEFSEMLLDNVVVVDNQSISKEIFDNLANFKEEELTKRSQILINLYQRISKQKTFEILNSKPSNNKRKKKEQLGSPETKLNVLYVGASVTAQKNGYRIELNKIFNQNGFDVQQTVLATGATGSMFGLCNLSTLIDCSTVYDLALFEYSTGDLNIGLTPNDAIEGVVFQSLQALKCLSKNVVLINNYRSDYEEGKGDFIRDLHKAAANRASVPFLDIYPKFESMRSTLQSKDWSEIYRDNVHTGSVGSKLVAEEIYAQLPELNLEKEVERKLLPSYQTGQFYSIPTGEEQFEYTYPSSGQKFPFIKIREGQTLRLTLKGQLWGVLSVVGPQSGWVEIKQGEARVQKFNQLDAHCYYTRIQPRQFIREFNDTVELTFELVDEPLDFSIVKKEHPKHELERELHLSYLMGRDLQILNAEILDK